jgi:tRNA threonylcarbamoyladenosine biosynthesis protein TsaE
MQAHPSPDSPTSITVHLASQAATVELGWQLGATLAPGQIVALSGDLGAGKTTLTQGIAAGMGIDARVTSPTFTLINQYNPGVRRLLLVHIDTYRLGESASVAHAEAANLGLEEILADAPLPDSHSDGAIVVIEWAERIANLLPANTLYIHLAPVPENQDARTATLTTSSQEVSALLLAMPLSISTSDQ